MNYSVEISPLDEERMTAAAKRQDKLLKPIGALGALETISIRLAGIREGGAPSLSKTAVAVFAADNNIHDEDISPVPQAVTASQSISMVRGIAGISVLTRHSGSDLYVVDVGIRQEELPNEIFARKIRMGAGNIVREDAMTEDEALKALKTGGEFAELFAQKGYGLVGAGEMGICNTSSASAVVACLSGEDVRAVTGKGAGLTDEGYEYKIRCLERALERAQPDPNDPVGVLCKVGGLDIAAMAGFYLGCAERRLPAVVDGFIAMAAALAAKRINPRVTDYLFASHRSEESGYAYAARKAGLAPMFSLAMRLGEGTGCPLAFNVIQAAEKCLNEMGTFEEGNVDGSVIVDIR